MGIAGQTSAYTLYLLDDSSIEDILTPPLLVIWVNILQNKNMQLKTQNSTHNHVRDLTSSPLTNPTCYHAVHIVQTIAKCIQK